MGLAVCKLGRERNVNHRSINRVRNLVQPFQAIQNTDILC
jgi:hypothetical protein